MKKNNYLKCVIGFPIGVMALMISYALVYLIDGKERYLIELSLLSDVGVLVNQIIISGIVYILFTLITIILYNFFQRTEKVLTVKDLLVFFIGLVVYAISINFVERLFQCGDEVKIVLEGVGIITVLVLTVGYAIVNAININIINKTLEKRNKDNK